MTKAEDIGVTMNKKTKRIGCSTLKELLEENRLTLVDRPSITELMTFVTKGTSYEADRGYHDDMVTTLILFSWFVTTEYFFHLPDTKIKDLLYAEQQKMMEEDLLPACIFGGDNSPTPETFVDNEGDKLFSINTLSINKDNSLLITGIAVKKPIYITEKKQEPIPGSQVPPIKTSSNEEE